MKPSLILLLVAGTACRGAGTPANSASTPASILQVEAPEATQYHADLKVNITEMHQTSSGLFLEDITPGAGDSVMRGSTAVVRYTGWLPSGQSFDSNVEGEPFAFRVGAGDVIQGWDEGVVGMRIGGKRKLVIPYTLGYGPDGYGPIPPFATLVFDVELTEVRQ